MSATSYQQWDYTTQSTYGVIFLNIKLLNIRHHSSNYSVDFTAISPQAAYTFYSKTCSRSDINKNNMNMNAYGYIYIKSNTIFQWKALTVSTVGGSNLPLAGALLVSFSNSAMARGSSCRSDFKCSSKSTAGPPAAPERNAFIKSSSL